MSWPQFEEALRLGDAHGALRAALAAPVHEVRPHVGALRRCDEILAGLQRWPQLPGSLAGDTALLGELTRTWAARRGAPALPPQLRELFSPARPEPGAAHFPVVLGDTGLVRRLVVRAGGEQPRHPVTDPAFLEALALATRVVAQALGRPTAALERDLCWRVEPDLPSNARIKGGSVGLAAVVALASFQLRRAPPALDVYTGCLRAEGSAARLVAVEPRTLPAKARAAARMQAGSTGVRFFHPADNHEPDTRSLEARRVRGALAEWLDEPALLDGAVQAARRLDPPPAVDLPDDCRCVLFLLLAADEPLSPALLGEATPAMRAATLGSAGPPLPRTGEHTRALEALGLAEPVGDGWIATEAARAQHARREDPAWYRAAHHALGAAQGWPPGTAPSRRTLHLLEVDQPQAAAAVLAAAPPGVAARALLELRDRGVALEHTAALVAALPEGAEAGLLRIVHAAAGLPPWLARLGRTLAAHEDWTDRLLTVQALVEAALHVLAAVALAEGLVDAQTRAELDRRPSVGLLGTAAATLAGAPGPRSAAGRLLAEAVAAQGPPFSDLGKHLNTALHQKLALGRLAADDEPGSRAHVAALAEAVVRLLEALAAAVRAGLDLRDRDADSARFAAVVDGAGDPLDLGEQLRRAGTADAPMFHRGRLGSRVRWWSYEDATSTWEPDPPAPPQSSASLAVDRLPAPLAAAWVRLGRASPGLEQLAALDLLLFALLRLVTGPGLARALADAGGLLAKPLDHALGRMNHRNLLDRAAQQDDALCRWLHHGSTRDPAEWLLDRVERHQHAPGPRAAWAASAGDLVAGARALLAAGPWTQATLVLADAPAHALCGPTPRLRPVDADRALAWAVGDALLPLGPIARVPAGAREIHLLVQVDQPRRGRPFADAGPSWHALHPGRARG